jgi:uncharacterized iron-regulated membrane protein
MGQFEATTGQAMTEAVAEETFPDAALAADAARRGALKSWHKGDAGGLAGQALGVLAGLGLLTMAVTGLLLYFQIRSARRGMHRKKYFWSGKESRWRTLHRWVAPVAAVFLLNIAVSGTVLAIGEFKLNLFLHHHIGTPPYPKPLPMPPVSAAALPRDLNAMLRTVYGAAHRQEPGGQIVALQLVVRDGLPKGLATIGGAAPHTVSFDALTGAAATDWATGGAQVGAGYLSDWHQYLKRMHRGDIVGHFAGRYFDLAAGLAFLYLVVSGMVMFLQQRLRRRYLGQAVK